MSSKRTFAFTSEACLREATYAHFITVIFFYQNDDRTNDLQYSRPLIIMDEDENSTGIYICIHIIFHSQ